MATTSTVPWYNNHERRNSSGNNKSTTTLMPRPIAGVTCPPSNFPDNFQDFFDALNEDNDDLPNMLEDKLIPRKDGSESYIIGGNNSNNINYDNNISSSNNNNSKQRWHKRAFQRRSSEVEVRLHGSSQGQGHDSSGGSGGGGPKSPTTSRRRSSSIAVARPTPDLHRFLQAEAGPWGHLSPSPRSPTRTPSLSPGAMSTTSHLSAGASPAGPSPTSPAGPTSNSRLPPQPKHRGRTSSMPAVPRHRPMLADTRRCGLGNIGNNGTAAVDGEEPEDGVEYYRVRSFSITANGVFNLGDALKSRRSRSINSVTSSGTSCSSIRDVKLLSSTSQLSGIENGTDNEQQSERVANYKVGMLGASGVGKTALTAQFCTSEYICAYDASLDDEYGQKNVSVMIDGQETDLEIIDHPATEMSVEAFCSTYNPDVFVIVYSVVDRNSFKFAEETLMYLWNNNYMATRGVILVGNMADLERKREVSTIMGRRLATTLSCKFIETSSGIAHHVDELLVGIIAQIKLNPQRNRDQANRRRRNKMKHHHRKILKNLLTFHRKTKSCENLFTI